MLQIRQFILNHFLLPAPFRWWIVEENRHTDFICPLSFGRNTWSDTAAVAIVNTAREELGHGSDIATFEWLRDQKFLPGWPNMKLAALCAKASQCNNGTTPIVGQWEVMYALWCQDRSWYKKSAHIFVTIWPPTEGYLGTHEVLREVRRIAENRGWKTPLLVAHPEHTPRIYFLWRMMSGEDPAVVYSAIPKVWRTHLDDWFDPKSVQWWTRGKWRWLFYELCIARAHNWIKGWL